MLGFNKNDGWIDAQGYGLAYRVEQITDYSESNISKFKVKMNCHVVYCVLRNVNHVIFCNTFYYILVLILVLYLDDARSNLVIRLVCFDCQLGNFQ